MLRACFFEQSAVNFIEPIDNLAIMATLIDEAGEAVAAITPALLAGHAQQIELDDEIAEDDCAVAGHGDHDRTENLASI